MFKHNLLLIFRNYKRFKSTFFINLIGLSTGLACALLIYLWVNDELHVDKFHENDSRLFQVMENSQTAGGILTGAHTPDLLAETLAEEMPEIEYAAAATPSDWDMNFTLSANDIHLKPTGKFAGKDYFNVFSYSPIQGDKNHVLLDKSSIVISEALAVQLFNTTENVVGKTLEWQLLFIKKPCVVSGVFKGTPANSSEQVDFLLSFEAWKDLCTVINRAVNWDNHGPSTYVVLQKGTDVDQFNRKIAGFIKSKIDWSNVTLFIRPYSEGYLYGKYENGVQAGGRIEYVKLFSIIAIFILAIACINFMNLSTAKASRRIKEVGIKKAIGAPRRALVSQYLGESMSMAFLSLLCAIIIVEIFLPQFNEITGKHLTMSFDANLILSVLGITIVAGILSGSYPALYLSRFNPSVVLKGKLNTSTGEVWARRGLVVFQFALSVMLIVSVLVVYKQTEYIQTKNLGYDKDNIIYFPMEGKVAENVATFLSEVKKIPGVVNASSTAHSLMESGSTTGGLRWEGKNPAEVIPFENVTVNYGMIETLDIKMKEGRSFSRAFGSDETKIIFNEAAIETMGLKDPVGKVIKLWDKEMQIIGVVKNFHFASLHEQVKPLFFLLAPHWTLEVMARIEAGKERETIDRLQKFYQQYNPGFSFDYKFLDADYQALYSAEQRVAVLSRYFAGIAIIISCLGLFGLAAFTAERRLKEIGIRKVLGASELGIIYLLSSDFTKMVFASIVIALPVSYLATKYWLDNFAYRIELEPWYFISAGFMALFIAWLTVGTQAVKAANINPAQCLRDE